MPPTTDRGIAPLAFVLILLVVFSGCTPSSSPSSVVDAALGTPSADASNGGSGAALAAVGGTGSSVSEIRPVDTADNSWRHVPVVAGVDTSMDGRDYASFAESTVDYWRVNASAVAYDPAFVTRPDSSDPDVTVLIVERVNGCGDGVGTDTVDCASLLDGDDSTVLTEPVTVVVAADYDDGATQMILKYEFGHLLGLIHDSANAPPVLSKRVETARLPGPDTGERESPFHE